MSADPRHDQILFLSLFLSLFPILGFLTYDWSFLPAVIRVSIHLWIDAIAGGLAIASKFWIQVNDKQVFNPYNFGVLTAIALILSHCTPLLGWIWQAPRFTWLRSKSLPSTPILA